MYSSTCKVQNKMLLNCIKYYYALTSAPQPLHSPLRILIGFSVLTHLDVAAGDVSISSGILYPKRKTNLDILVIET